MIGDGPGARQYFFGQMRKLKIARSGNLLQRADFAEVDKGAGRQPRFFLLAFGRVFRTECFLFCLISMRIRRPENQNQSLRCVSLSV